MNWLAQLPSRVASLGVLARLAHLDGLDRVAAAESVEDEFYL